MKMRRERNVTRMDKYEKAMRHVVMDYEDRVAHNKTLHTTQTDIEELQLLIHNYETIRNKLPILFKQLKDKNYNFVRWQILLLIKIIFKGEHNE